MTEELRIDARPKLERPVLIAAFRGWNDGGQGASLAAGYLADAGMAGIVTNNDDIAGEERRVRAREIEQHVVVAGHRDNTHLGDFW